VNGWACAQVAGSAVALGGSALIALSGGDAGYSTAAWVLLAAALCSPRTTLQQTAAAAGTPVSKSPLRHVDRHALSLPWPRPPSRPRVGARPRGRRPCCSSACCRRAGFRLWLGVARNTVTTADGRALPRARGRALVAYVWLGEVPGRPRWPARVSIGGVALIGCRRRPRRMSVKASYTRAGRR